VIGGFIRRELFLAVSLLTVLIFARDAPFLFSHLSNPVWCALIFLWLFTAVMGSALSVVRHADLIAERLGEPYGTLILTLSVTAIEAMSITAVMLHGANNPTLVRDTLFSVIMIMLNGMVGLSLLVGAWRHREQFYNLQGANTYLGVIIPLAVLGLILPNVTITTTGPTLSGLQSAFLGVISISLYGIFLVMQTSRHRGYFILEGDPTLPLMEPADRPNISLAYHAMMLVIYMAPVAFLAEQFAHPVDYYIETLHAPAPLGGLAIALLVATPEAIGAVRAASANDLQRSVNIFLGSVLSTIGLTIPVMLLVSHLTQHPIFLGLERGGPVMLLLTLFLSVVTFASGRTNLVQGAVHIVLFATYLLLIVES
jgi:Ca2+:H+ antiporter